MASSTVQSESEQPCVVYVDSMNGHKPNAFLRIKAYLSLEYEEKVVKVEEAELI